MPFGLTRLNERTQRPNPNINFITPLPGTHSATSLTFLSRIAALMVPIMTTHHFSVMTLEEHEPNPEFLGRNFNAGEVIQLVLRDRKGGWLSERAVALVMVHELAHCKEMNHSRSFWKVRNELAVELEGLWTRGYKGDGLWGLGRGLEDGGIRSGGREEGVGEVRGLCGGSWRRRGRKRRRKGGSGSGDAGGEREKVSYAERQQRRIKRKFGIHGEGETVGENELLRGALETMQGGKRSVGKPRVAGSKRGRELRANAALLRFESLKNEQNMKKEEENDVVIKQEEHSDSETEWEEDDIEADFTTIKDGRGVELVRVCGGEDENDEHANHERDELESLNRPPQKTRIIASDSKDTTIGKQLEMPQEADADSDTEDEAEPVDTPQKQSPNNKTTASASENSEQQRSKDTIDTAAPLSEVPSTACPICSLHNDPDSVTCTACAHVLRPKLVANSWRCLNDNCAQTKYLNAGDAGRCGLCGALKPVVETKIASSNRRDEGVTSAAVLRWE